MINLMHGDCLELMKSIPDKSIDMVLTDPPYGTTACKWDVVIPFEPMWNELKRITKDNGAICLFGSEPFSSHLRLSNLKMFKYDWIWDKVKPGNIFNSKRQPLTSHEIISIFGFKINYYPIKNGEKIRKTKIYSKSKTQNHPEYKDERVLIGKYPKQLIRFSNANQLGRVHPTQKPVELLEYLIKTYTLENETILDFTMGSGSTGVACKNLNRNFIGIEKDDKYFEIAKNRINQA
jgi:site-specific DNA-methyltransferase (adenine-specific)